MRLTRSAFTRLLAALPASTLVYSPLPARALIGEVIGDGFTQADDKSWDLTLPSAQWRLAEQDFRAEFPSRPKGRAPAAVKKAVAAADEGQMR